MSYKIKQVICPSKKDFKKLAGDKTEVVKLSFTLEFLSGWYLLQKEGENNRFTRQSSLSEPVIHEITCETRHLSWDKHKQWGIIPDSNHYKLASFGQDKKPAEYGKRRKMLEDRGLYEVRL